MSNLSPLTLQSLCCKILSMQENYLALCKEAMFINEIDEEINLAHSMNVNASLNDALPCGSETINDDLNFDLNTEEWLNLEEFGNIVQKQQINMLSTQENYTNEFLEKDYGNFSKNVVDNTHIDETTTDTAEIKNLNIKGENKDSIILISGDSELDLSLPEDIDSISLNSVQAFENSKIMIEISPHIQYVANLNQANIIKDISTEPIKFNSFISKDFKEINENLDTISITSNDSYCSGYNSSDFEFITEEAARSEGLATNYNKTRAACPIQVNEPSRNIQNYRITHQIPDGENYYDLFRDLYAPTMAWYENKSMAPMMNTEYAGVGFDIGVLRRQIREYQPDDEYKEEADECAKKILTMYPRENRRRRRFY